MCGPACAAVVILGKVPRIGLRMVLVLLGLIALVLPGHAQPNRPVVHLVPISGTIDLGLAPFLKRVLDEAAGGGAALVILDINTFGGRVDAAVAIRDTLLEAKVRTVGFVHRRAISAGALIALATDHIAVSDGATIGAAMPVEAGLPGAGTQAVGEKTVSYVRKEFRATAEARRRPPLIAEAMVDADVEIPGLVEKGKLLTLSTEEALAHKLADFKAARVESVLAELGLAGAEIRTAAPTWAEELVRILTHPIVSSLLIMLGILGVVTEIRTPGFGVPGAVGIASLGLFFYGHWLVNLAGWEELLLVGAGVLLLVVELFITPGFGVPGVLGIAAVIAGLGLSLTGAGATPEAMLRAAAQVMLALLVAIVGAVLLLRGAARMRFGRQFVLEQGLTADAGFAAPPDVDRRYLGAHGVAHSMLRPAGLADVAGDRVDVVSDGEFIEAGAPIVVVRVDGNRIVVRRAPPASPKGG